MAQWNRSESGILRKFKKKDNFEDLLVFGYACKIFRDDEKALYIDQGKHLIPWMGDEKLKIDRYDCRGHLSEIKRYEANSAGYDATRWLGLDDNERKLEQLCDEERYYSLTINEEEDEMYKEEEKKRIQTNEFQYSYDVPMKPEEEGVPTVPENDEDEVYVPPPGLDVPADMHIPSTMKENARIEKTAMFVSAQGPQMEILIKAKQANNSQFSFLSQKDPLYKFYRHILNAIKSGRFKKAKSDDNALGASEIESGEYYLHPSLVSSTTSNTEQPLPAIPTVPYRPSVNCTYSQLVNRIQSTTAGENGAPSSGTATQQQNTSPDQKQPNTENATFDQQQYYQYYLQQQYYEYYNQLSQTSGADPMSDPKLLQLQQMVYAQYLQQSSQIQQEPNPYAQIVSNVNKDVPNLDSTSEKPDILKEPILYDTNTESKVPIQAPVTSLPIISGDKPAVEAIIPEKTSLLSLIQNYHSDSDRETSDDEQVADDDFEVPDDETKVVIDKMASYVVKNGKDFEEIVRSRLDPRFVFLNSDNQYNKYYQKRVDEEIKQKKQLEHSKENDAEKTEESKSIGKGKEKKTIAPVSFSIKKMKEEPPKEIKSALPVDEETDEEIEDVPETSVPLPIAQPPTLVSSSTQKNLKPEPPSKDDSKQTEQLIKEKNAEVETPVKSEEETDKKTIEKSAVHEKSKSPVNSEKCVNSTNVILVKDDPILEMIDLTDDIYNEKDSNTKDVSSESIVNTIVLDDVSLLSNIEKCPTENKALQLERRRKAMAFLKLKSANSTTDPDSSSSKRKRRSCDSLDEDIKSVVLEFKGEKLSKDQSANNKGVVQKEIYRSRRSKNDREVKKYEYYEVSDVEDSKNSDKSEGRSRKSHKKKKSHKRKRSKCKHHSKTKKKTKKKDSKYISSSSSDTDSSHS